MDAGWPALSWVRDCVHTAAAVGPRQELSTCAVPCHAARSYLGDRTLNEAEKARITKRMQQVRGCAQCLAGWQLGAVHLS